MMSAIRSWCLGLFCRFLRMHEQLGQAVVRAILDALDVTVPTSSALSNVRPSIALAVTPLNRG